MQLIVVDPQSGRRKAVPLSSAVLRVGSAVDCDLVLPGNDVAAHALTVTWEGDHLVVEAVDDATFLHNEQKSRGAILHIGDVMRLGGYQLVVAPLAGAAPAAAAPPPAPPPSPEPIRPAPRPAAEARPAVRPAAPVTARAAAAFSDETAEEGRGAAARRRPTKQHDGHFGLIFLVLLAGGAAGAWYLGWFDRVLPAKYVSPRKPDPKEEVAVDPAKEKSKEKAGSAGSAGAKKEDGGSGGSSTSGRESGAGEEAGAENGEAAGGDDGSWREESSRADIDATFKEVAKLLEAEEYSSCRWLLWQLHPKETADVARVEQRRKEVDAAAAKGGAAHLKLVDDLIKKGRLQTALNYCVEESIDRFRGTETWYALLDKADAIEAIIDETVPEDRRLSTKRKHGRTRPPDLATRPPPPVKVAELDVELVPIEKTAGRKPPERGREPERGAEKGREPTAPNEPEKPAEPPSAEQLALREKVVAAITALAAAKPAAVEAKLKSLATVAEAAGPAAVAPLTERAAALGDLLDAAPEKAALAELRAKCLALKAAREAAFAFLDDGARYFMLDPKAPGDVNRGEELAAAQKEADKLVDAVRDQWGSELGGAPAPQVNLSEGYARLVQEAQAIDALLAAQKTELPAKTELLMTRLLPNWSRKVHVRNYALDVVERERLDRDRLVRTANQRVRDVDGDALEMLSTVNAYREMFGRPQLQWDGKLATSAQLLASLRTKEAKAYKDSDPQPMPEPRQAAEGGVNLLRGRFSARQGLQAWTKMAGAHRNLIDAEHRSVGIGVDAKYWVVKFGKFVPGSR